VAPCAPTPVALPAAAPAPAPEPEPEPAGKPQPPTPPPVALEPAPATASELELDADGKPLGPDGKPLEGAKLKMWEMNQKKAAKKKAVPAPAAAGVPEPAPAGKTQPTPPPVASAPKPAPAPAPATAPALAPAPTPAPAAAAEPVGEGEGEAIELPLDPDTGLPISGMKLKMWCVRPPACQLLGSSAPVNLGTGAAQGCGTVCVLSRCAHDVGCAHRERKRKKAGLPLPPKAAPSPGMLHPSTSRNPRCHLGCTCGT
jgi:hypothetical protein